MRPGPSHHSAHSGSTLIIVLWIAFGLVSLTLYFANSMSLELRAADNRVSGMGADQAIEGAARYVSYLLANAETNGIAPDPLTVLSEAGKIGESRFWLIGRDTNTLATTDRVFFGLIDEASKINLNTATSNMLVYLPRMNLDLCGAIQDWRDTNGGSGAFATYYAMARPSYDNKYGPFDTVEELRLVYGADMDTLVGEDLNQNGILDPNEEDLNHNGGADPGVLEYVTVYSREPNTYSNGTPRINIRAVTGSGEFLTLLQNNLGTSVADRVLSQLGLSGGGGGPGGGGRPGGGGGGAAGAQQFTSPLQFFRRSGLSTDEFAAIAEALTVSTNSYIVGRVNINTASPVVLACLPGICDSPDLADTIVNYRTMNPGRLSSIGWIVDAIGSNNTQVLDELAATDCITVRSYQFTADIAALGPYGRGYRRTRFVFDTSEGAPKIVYRQDLTHLGWALGRDVRQKWVYPPDSR